MENQNVNHRRNIKDENHSFGKINPLKSNNYSDNKTQNFSQNEKTIVEEEKLDVKVNDEVFSLVKNLNKKDPNTIKEVIELLSKLAIKKESVSNSREQSPEINSKTIAKNSGNKFSSTTEHAYNMKRPSLPNNDVKNTFQASPLNNIFDSVKATTREIRDFKAFNYDSRNSELVHNPMSKNYDVILRL